MNRSCMILRSLLELADINTFTHNGHDYDLGKLNKLIKDNPIQNFDIKDLTWIFKYDDPDRIKSAWSSLPIIVTKWNSQLVVLDGLHRLKKAQMAGNSVIAGRMVKPEQLLKVKIK